MTATLETHDLRQRAAGAHREAQRIRDGQAQRRFEEDRNDLAKLIKDVLGVEREHVKFERQNEHGAARAVIDDLSFVTYGTDYGPVLDLISPCGSCGAERRATIRTLEKLGELIADEAKFYHYCPRPVDQDNTPEGRLLTALRDLIAQNMPTE